MDQELTITNTSTTHPAYKEVEKFFSSMPHDAHAIMKKDISYEDDEDDGGHTPTTFYTIVTKDGRRGRVELGETLRTVELSVSPGDCQRYIVRNVESIKGQPKFTWVELILPQDM